MQDSNSLPTSIETDTDTLSSKLAGVSVQANGYPSLSPPGHYSPTVQQTFSGTQTPTAGSSVPYASAYLDDGSQYAYYNPGIPAFSPSSGPPTATAFNYQSSMPSPHTTSGDTMIESNYGGIDMFPPETPILDPQSPPPKPQVGIYRPPHVQQALQQQQQRQAAATLQQQQQAAYFAYGDVRQMWWAQPMNNAYHTPLTPESGDRKKPGQQSFNGLKSSSMPYTPKSRGSLSGSGSLIGTSTTGPSGFATPARSPSAYGYLTPSSLQRQGYGRNGRNGGLYSPSYKSPTASGNGYQHTPYTPASNRPAFGPRRRIHAEDEGSRRSELLEDFRSNKHGRKYELHQKLETCSVEDKQRMFDEIMPSAYQLMTDVFGNYVIQKMFELGDQWQKASLAEKMDGKVYDLSVQMYGCRVVQKALDHLLPEERASVVEELEPHILACVRSNNANHVIQRLVVLDPPPSSLPQAFVGHLEELAMNAFGCRVIQKMFEILPEDMKRELLDEMHPIASKLMQDQFGNYVVQSVIAMGAPADRDAVIEEIKGQMLTREPCQIRPRSLTPVSRHKFASNVCEKALLHASVEDRRHLIVELIDAQPDGTTKIPILLRDAFGNFPLQTALQCAEEDQRVQLLDLIIPVLPLIRQTPVGKRLEARLTQWEADGSIISATEAGANTAAYRQRMASLAPRLSRTRSIATSDSGYSIRSGSTGITSPSTPFADHILRSSASTPIRPPEKGDQKGKTKEVLEDLLQTNRL